MNAKEANKVATDFLKNRSDKQYNEILSIIKDKAGKGKFEVEFYNPFELGVKPKLEAEGYKITTIPDNRDGDYYKIGW